MYLLKGKLAHHEREQKMTNFICGYKKDITGKKAQEQIFSGRYGSRVQAMYIWLIENGYKVDKLVEAGTTNSFYFDIRKNRGRKVRHVRLSDHFNGQDSENKVYFSLKKPIYIYKDGYDKSRIEKLFS